MEIELKLALTPPEALERLLANLPTPDAVITQTNHYFADPLGLLARDRVMVRVRESVNEAGEGPQPVVLTIKKRAEVNNGLFIAQEDEYELDPGAWQVVRDQGGDLRQAEVKPLEALCESIGVSMLFKVGAFRNTRRCIPFQGLMLEVDRTEFPGGRVDVEVEVETEDVERARRVLMTFADSHHLHLQPQTLGKYSRFVAIINDAAS